MTTVGAIVLAAGRGRRFGEDSKLLASFRGSPLIRRVASTALASRARPVLVVTGHASHLLAAALSGFDLRLVHNAAHGDGMALTLAAGIGALPHDVDGALVLLGDMPLVKPETLDRLIDTFRLDAAGIDAVLPVFHERSGNPVLLGRSMFGELSALEGDTGARHLLARGCYRVVRCAVDDPGILLDIDTRQALDALQAEPGA